MADSIIKPIPPMELDIEAVGKWITARNQEKQIIFPPYTAIRSRTSLKEELLKETSEENN